MAKYITQAQMDELEEACSFDIEDGHDLLRKYAGIEARAYTAYQYYDEDGTFIGCSDEFCLDDLLEKQMWRCGMDKLKPCPFCGGEALLEPYRARKGYEASIQCNQCLCSMSTITYDKEETAIEDVVKAWNRRVNDV